MNFELLGFMLDVVGKVMVAYTAIAVHHRVWKKHKIDAAVFKSMRREQIVGVTGIFFIIVGFLLQLPAKF